MFKVLLFQKYLGFIVIHGFLGFVTSASANPKARAGHNSNIGRPEEQRKDEQEVSPQLGSDQTQDYDEWAPSAEELARALERVTEEEKESFDGYPDFKRVMGGSDYEDLFGEDRRSEEERVMMEQANASAERANAEDLKREEEKARRDLAMMMPPPPEKVAQHSKPVEAIPMNVANPPIIKDPSAKHQPPIKGQSKATLPRKGIVENQPAEERVIQAALLTESKNSRQDKPQSANAVRQQEVEVPIFEPVREEVDIAGETIVHRRAQEFINRRDHKDQGETQVLINGVDVFQHVEAVKEEAIETGKPLRDCEDNEIYIVDGDRTLLLTNNRIAKDINKIQETEDNLVRQIGRQDKVIELLKQRLNHSESQMDESMNVLRSQEQTYAALVSKINASEVRLNSVMAHNKILEDQHGQDRAAVDNKQRKIEQLRSQIQGMGRVIEALERQVDGEYNRKLDSMRTEQNGCENQLRRRDADVDTLQSRIRLLDQKVDTCRNTCAKRSRPCSLLRGQVSEQDATIGLLKGELRTQSDAMAALNQMVNYKQTALENLNSQVRAQIDSQHLLQAELAKKDQLIQTQYQTISILRKVDEQEEFLSRAKAVALRILQNTVYSMASNIASCKDATIKGLHQEIDSVRQRILPTEHMVQNLRYALANTRALEQFHRDVTNSMQDFLKSKNRTLELMQAQVDGLRNIRDVCAKKCTYDQNVIRKMEELYRPVNKLSCQPLCQPSPVSPPQPPQNEPTPTECKGSPNVESETGLVKMAPPTVKRVDDYEAKAGQSLTYICREGRVIDKASGRRTIEVHCRQDGTYAVPRQWPKCI